MAQSSDEIIKREIVEKLGTRINNLELWIFPESSNQDQKIFGDQGGLTFGVDGIAYGSCDACWIKHSSWRNTYNGNIEKVEPIVALEGTDALNRGSSGNAQYQRFHHALGAVKSGLTGIYYLKKGIHKIQPDLFGMAVAASKIELGNYLIINNLKILKELLEAHKTKKFNRIIKKELEKMDRKFRNSFKKRYGSWDNFAKKRSTIIKDNYVIKITGRMKRNFTESSQRAGHIALGEMYLTKYFFPDKFVYYLWPKMSTKSLKELDLLKRRDKEWRLLRNEENVKIVTRDNIKGLDKTILEKLAKIENLPLKGKVLSEYNQIIKEIKEKLESDELTIGSKL